MGRRLHGAGSRWASATKHGYPLDEVSSSLQKSIRRGWTSEAMYWAVELNESGYGEYAWRRLIVIASEDVGPANHHAAVLVHALYENSRRLKAAARSRTDVAGLMPFEPLLQAVWYLAGSPKSRELADAYATLTGRLARGELLPIPDIALDVHTRRGRSLGRGMRHFVDEAAIVEPEVRLNDNPWRTAFLKEVVDRQGWLDAAEGGDDDA